MAGSVAKRPDGRWRARYRDDTGREHSKHFKRKIDGQRWLDDVTTSVNTGTYVDPRAGRITFRAYAERWRQAAPHGLSMKDKVERALRLHAYPAFGDMQINAIRPSTLQGWATALPLAPSSAGVVLAHVSSVFRAAVRDRIIPVSPADDVKPPPAWKTDVFIPDLATVKKVRQALPARYRAVIDLAIGSGMRSGELFGAEVGAVDFLGGHSVSVHQQLISLSPEPLHLGQVKTEESGRVIPLAQVTLDALAAHLAEYPARTREIEDRTDPRRKPITRDARLIFTTPAGSPLGRGMWSEIWRPAARTAGLPPRTGVHCLRHWFASALIAHGESVTTVQHRLGHSSATVTLDTYAHLWPNSDDRTRDAVAAALQDHADSLRTTGS